MNRDRILAAIEHPRPDRETASDPAFTSSVMRQLAHEPAAADRRRRIATWIIGGVLFAVAAWLLPLGTWGESDLDLASGAPEGWDLDLALSLIAVVAVAVFALRRGKEST